MVKFEDSEISKKLSKISEVMADGFYFLRMREYVTQWQELAKSGDHTAQEMMKVIDTFHRLCMVVKNRS